MSAGGYERTNLVDCGSVKPKIVENRRVGAEHRSRRSRTPIWDAAGIGDGTACAGRHLRCGKLTGRGISVPEVAVGHGGHLRKKENSQKT